MLSILEVVDKKSLFFKETIWKKRSLLMKNVKEKGYSYKQPKGIKLRLFSFVACFDILRICASNYIHKMLSIFEVVD